MLKITTVVELILPCAQKQKSEQILEDFIGKIIQIKKWSDQKRKQKSTVKTNFI